MTSLYKTDRQLLTDAFHPVRQNPNKCQEESDKRSKCRCPRPVKLYLRKTWFQVFEVSFSHYRSLSVKWASQSKRGTLWSECMSCFLNHSLPDMEFLEVLTEGLNRVLLVRGGGREVITIYSWKSKPPPLIITPLSALLLCHSYPNPLINAAPLLYHSYSLFLWHSPLTLNQITQLSFSTSPPAPTPANQQVVLNTKLLSLQAKNLL